MMINILQPRPAIPILLFLICLKWGDWKNWRKYYSTILYVIIWVLFYEFFYKEYPLWRFKNNTFSVLLIMCISFPSSILLYLPYVEKQSMTKQILHIALWTFLFSLFEAISIATHTISYYHGWNFCYSIGFNVLTFCMIRLHYKNALLAWPISVFLFIAAMIIFRLPLSSLL